MSSAHTVMPLYGSSVKACPLMGCFCHTRVPGFKYKRMQGLRQCARPAGDVHQGVSAAIQEHLCRHGLPQVYSHAFGVTLLILLAV